MEEMFLYVVHSISDSRFWLMPLILFCSVVICGVELKGFLRGQADDKL